MFGKMPALIFNNEMLVFVAFQKNARPLRMKRLNKEYPSNYSLKILQSFFLEKLKLIIEKKMF